MQQVQEQRARGRHQARQEGDELDIGASDAQADYLTTDKPATISAILILLMVVTPLFACLGGFNQTSGDNATAAYASCSIRTERPNIFVGRFIGTYLFMAAVFAMLFAVPDAYILAQGPRAPTGAMMLW